MESGGFPGLQNQCDLTVSGRVGSIPIHSRQSRFRLLLTIGLVLASQAAPAQKPDTARVRATTPARVADSLKPPLSPRRAFLYSALVPGLGQAKLGRNRAAAVMLAVEAVGISMIRESAADVREARRMSGPSVVVSYVGANGAALSTPDTTSRRFDSQYVHSRQSHVEDWVAFLVANHLFSGADAFVAANLWDVPAQLGIRLMPGRATIGAKLTW